MLIGELEDGSSEQLAGTCVPVESSSVIRRRKCNQNECQHKNGRVSPNVEEVSQKAITFRM